ncbi:hypothetical protein Brsp01_44050 [Brucella sp. NBRC 12950]|nr:hypothetical protein Brsp01_44050 [Brucella sp. NBRC 12950]
MKTASIMGESQIGVDSLLWGIMAADHSQLAAVARKGAEIAVVVVISNIRFYYYASINI